MFGDFQPFPVCKGLVHHPTEPTILKWMFQVPGMEFLQMDPNLKSSSIQGLMMGPGADGILHRFLFSDGKKTAEEKKLRNPKIRG